MKKQRVRRLWRWLLVGIVLMMAGGWAATNGHDWVAANDTALASSMTADQSSTSSDDASTSKETTDTETSEATTTTDDDEAVYQVTEKYAVKEDQRATSDSTSKASATSETNQSAATSSTKTTQRTKAAATSTSQASASVTVPSGGSVYDDYPNLNNVLGIASQFHIFAREATLSAHTNGNLAVQNLHGKSDFGTKNVSGLIARDISYLQHFESIFSSSFVTASGNRTNKVIFGQAVTIDLTESQRPKVNGIYLDHLSAKEVFQDQNNQVYIDFDQEFQALLKTSLDLRQLTSQKRYTKADFKDENNRVIDISDLTVNKAGQIVIELAADVLSLDRPLKIKGLTPSQDGPTVIINVDTDGADTYQMNAQIKLAYTDGTERHNHESDYFKDNHLLWNFTAKQQAFAGTIAFNNTFQGSVLAPQATLLVKHNLDGNMIATKVEITGETHRWDLQDDTDGEVAEPDPEEIIDPEDPEESTDPEEPEDPEEPTDLEEPTAPEEPTDPEDPEEPTDPEESTETEEPTDSEDPANLEEVNESTDGDLAVADDEDLEPAYFYSEDYDQAVAPTATRAKALNAALSKPVKQQRKATQTVLSQLDHDIAQANGAKQPIKATRLSQLRTQGLLASALPQTGTKRPHIMIATTGVALTVGTVAITWKMRRYL